MTASPSVGRILTVCTANVCRSPLAALRLQAQLRGPFASAVVSSAGVRAAVGAPMCAVARGRLADPEVADAHVAREITAAVIAEADLVLTMEKEQRGAVARLAPGQQGKVFTLREAAAMIDVIGAEPTRPTTVAELVSRMHALRGVVRPPLEESPQRPWFLRFLPQEQSTDDGLSIEDGHVIDDPAHERTVAIVAQLVDGIAVALDPHED